MTGRERAMPGGLLRCTGPCGLDLPPSDFSPKAKGYRGLAPRCRACHRLDCAASRAKPECKAALAAYRKRPEVVARRGVRILTPRAKLVAARRHYMRMIAAIDADLARIKEKRIA